MGQGRLQVVEFGLTTGACAADVLALAQIAANRQLADRLRAAARQSGAGRE